MFARGLLALAFGKRRGINYAQLFDASYSASGTSGSSAATVTVGSGGSVSGGPVVDVGSGSYAWLLFGVNSDYEVQGTALAGSPFGPSGWNALSANRTFSITQVGVGFKSCRIRLDIRRVADPSTIIASCEVYLEAEII